MASVSNTTHPVVTVTPVEPSAPSFPPSSAKGAATLVKRDLENFNTLSAKVWDVVPLELYGNEKENVDSIKKSALKIAAAFVTFLPVVTLVALTFVFVDSIRFCLYKAGAIDGKGFKAFEKAMSCLNKLLSPNLDFAKAVGQRLSKALGEAMNFPERNIDPAGANAILRNALKEENREILARASKMGRAELAYFKQNIVQALNTDLKEKAFSFRMGDGSSNAGTNMIDLALKGTDVLGGEIPSIFKGFGKIVALKDAEDFLAQVEVDPATYESAMKAFVESKKAATSDGLATSKDYASKEVLEKIQEALAAAATPDESPDSAVSVKDVVGNAQKLGLIDNKQESTVKQAVSSKVEGLKAARETAAKEAAAKAQEEARAAEVKALQESQAAAQKAAEEAKAQAAIQAQQNAVKIQEFNKEIDGATAAANQIIGKQAELDQLLSEIEKDLQNRGSLADGYKAVLDQALTNFKMSYGEDLRPLFSALASNPEEFAELREDLQNIIAPVRNAMKNMQDRTQFEHLNGRLMTVHNQMESLKKEFDSKWTGVAQRNWEGTRMGDVSLYQKHTAYVALKAKLDEHFRVYSPRAFAIFGKGGLVDQLDGKIAATLNLQLPKKKTITAEAFFAKAPVTGGEETVSAEAFLSSSPVTGVDSEADAILGDLPESDESVAVAPTSAPNPTFWNRFFSRKTA